jgi:tetratricopeptide (TPR) repeat protein
VRERYEELLAQAEQAFANGDPHLAVELFARAEQWADEHGEQGLSDRAFCARCSALLEVGGGGEQIPRLKQVLLRSTNPRIRFMAAYTTAAAYDIDGEADKASSYADRAMAVADEIGDPVITARAANLAGTLAVRGSRFDGAEDAYSRSLAAHEGLDGYHRVTEAQVRDNLGYVLMCTDRVPEGLRLCEEARTALEGLDAEFCLHETLQDLCYGYLLDDQLDRAEACGERALELAISNDDPLVVKNCLFLLGETAVRRGDAFRARRRLRELASYFPEVSISEEVVDVLLATDMTSVVNLRG